MIKLDNNDSNGNPWELEILCKNKEYLNLFIKEIIKLGNINFEVECNDVGGDTNGNFDGTYSVLLWSYWFNNLNTVTKKLKKIEKKLN